MKKFAILALVVLVLALATGCQALGLTPKADAPAYSGVGVLVVGADNSVEQRAKGDQSGAVGASGSASQTQEIPEEALAALVDAAQVLIASGQPAAASAVLGTILPKPKAEKAPQAAPVAPAKPEAPPAAPAPDAAPAAPAPAPAAPGGV